MDEKSPVCAKLSDFGKSEHVIRAWNSSSVDNPVWLAPEILQGHMYTENVDNYAFGVICWELISRKDFFGEEFFVSDISAKVMSGKRPEIPTHCPTNFSKLISTCWVSILTIVRLTSKEPNSICQAGILGNFPPTYGNSRGKYELRPGIPKSRPGAKTASRKEKIFGKNGTQTFREKSSTFKNSGRIVASKSKKSECKRNNRNRKNGSLRKTTHYFFITETRKSV